MSNIKLLMIYKYQVEVVKLIIDISNIKYHINNSQPAPVKRSHHYILGFVMSESIKNPGGYLDRQCHFDNLIM